MSLTTGRRLSRHQWMLIPMTDAIIACVEAIAEAEGQPLIVGGILAFEWQPDVPINDSDDDDGDDDDDNDDNDDSMPGNNGNGDDTSDNDSDYDPDSNSDPSNTDGTDPDDDIPGDEYSDEDDYGSDHYPQDMPTSDDNEPSDDTNTSTDTSEPEGEDRPGKMPEDDVRADGNDDDFDNMEEPRSVEPTPANIDNGWEKVQPEGQQRQVICTPF